MEIQCKFYTDENDYPWMKNPYKCDVLKLTKYSLEREIQLVEAIHENGKSNSDVVWMSFSKQSIVFLPRNLHEIFPNLRLLSLNSCGIENISRKDLKGLEHLEYIDLDHNRLTSIPDDLFADLGLRCVHLRENPLQRMSSKLFMPIRHTLEMAFITTSMCNVGFDLKGIAGKLQDFEDFMKAIDLNFKPPAL